MWNRDNWIIILFFLLCLLLITETLSKYSTNCNKTLTITATQPEYNIVFNSNLPTGKTASGTISNQHFVYGTPNYLSSNSYTVSGYTFTGCNKCSTNG